MSPNHVAYRQSLSQLLLDSHEELSALAHIVNGTGCELYVIDSEARRLSCPEMTMRFALQERYAANADDYAARMKSAPCRAPLRDAGGTQLATLEVDPLGADTAQAHSLLMTLLLAASRAVEERAFRKLHRRRWLVALTARGKDGTGMLMAVDHAQKIVAVDRVAHARLSMDNEVELEGVSLWSLLVGDRSRFCNRPCGDVPTTLVGTHDGQEYVALVTPPEVTARVWRAPNMVDVHSRPRLHAVSHQYLLQPSATYRGGLTSRVQRAVRDYIDAHLEDSIGIEALADLAGLSTSHFARQFKQSVGLTPHNYVMQRRLAKAQELIATTALSLAAIASTTGFADQAHLSRCFRGEVGMSPRSFRRMTSDRATA